MENKFTVPDSKVRRTHRHIPEYNTGMVYFHKPATRNYKHENDILHNSHLTITTDGYTLSFIWQKPKYILSLRYPYSRNNKYEQKY